MKGKRLKLVKLGDDLWVNPDKVTYVCPAIGDATAVHFAGDEDNYALSDMPVDLVVQTLESEWGELER